MKQVNFKTQFLIGIIALILAHILGYITQNGIFINIAWVLYGLAFIINPVYPNPNGTVFPQKGVLGARIGGVLVIIVGLITRFGV